MALEGRKIMLYKRSYLSVRMYVVQIGEVYPEIKRIKKLNEHKDSDLHHRSQCFKINCSP